jgi:hypothetical protein
MLASDYIPVQSMTTAQWAALGPHDSVAPVVMEEFPFNPVEFLKTPQGMIIGGLALAVIVLLARR